MRIKKFIQQVNENPKKLFLMDGWGAVLSAFLLGVVLVKLENLFGIPASTLYFLALLPCSFALYDFYCYFQIKTNLGVYLKGIAAANLIYCFVSIGLAVYHKDLIQVLGWIYIGTETVILSMFVWMEWRVAKITIERENTNMN